MLINPWFSIVSRVALGFYFFGFVFNLIGFPFSPGFPLYYFSLTAGLAIGFVVFAETDVDFPKVPALERK